MIVYTYREMGSSVVFARLLVLFSDMSETSFHVGVLCNTILDACVVSVIPTYRD